MHMHIFVNAKHGLFIDCRFRIRKRFIQNSNILRLVVSSTLDRGNLIIFVKIF